jgi:hypothetical protein
VRKTHVLGLLVAAAVGLLVVGTVSLAQTTSTIPPSTTTAPGAPGSNFKDSFLQHLAGRLGVPMDKLTQAVKDAAKDAVDDAVRSGKIDQQRADQIKQRIDSGDLSFLGLRLGGPKGFGGFPGGGIKGRQILTDTATAVGITPQQLADELRGGKTLDDIAREHGKDPTAVRKALQDSIRKELQPLVDSGRLTAQQADQRAQRLAQSFGNGALGHRGGRRPFGPGSGSSSGSGSGAAPIPTPGGTIGGI